MITETILLTAFSDLLLNLSAGWFGAAFIIPITIVKGKKRRFWTLFINIVLGIVALSVAVIIRSQI